MDNDDPRPLAIPAWMLEKAAEFEPIAPPSDDEIVAALLVDGRREQWLRICPPRFYEADIETLDGKTVEKITAWVDNPKGSLLLAGPTGTGKTFAALAAARSLHSRGRKVVFHPVTELLNHLRPGGGATIDDLIGPDVLILDDLGAERPTEWTGEQLEAVINRRWLNLSTTIVTTNMPSREDLKVAIGGAAFDRLRDGATILWLDGPSRRGGRP